MYPIRRESYSIVAMDEFKSDILRTMSAWINKRTERNDTENMGYETLLVEWDKEEHKKHEIQYL